VSLNFGTTATQIIEHTDTNSVKELFPLTFYLLLKFYLSVVHFLPSMFSPQPPLQVTMTIIHYCQPELSSSVNKFKLHLIALYTFGFLG